jgi:peptidyl-prolyl cis-trans isomerase C
VQQAIDDELIFQESRKVSVAGLDEEKFAEQIEEKIDAMRSKHESDEGFEANLKARNQTVDGLRDTIRSQVQVSEYLKQKGIRDPEIPEEEIRAFYDKDPNAYNREEYVDVSHILIPVAEDAAPEAVEAAQQKAEQIRKEILGGEDFGEKAKAHSSCNSASGGGRLGPIKRGYMPKEFEDTAFSMAEDETKVSEPVRTKYGYHLIRVYRKTPAGPAPYEDVREFIRKFLQELATKKNLAAHIAELKQKAKIEMFLNES